MTTLPLPSLFFLSIGLTTANIFLGRIRYRVDVYRILSDLTGFSGLVRFCTSITGLSRVLGLFGSDRVMVGQFDFL